MSQEKLIEPPNFLLIPADLHAGGRKSAESAIKLLVLPAPPSRARTNEPPSSAHSFEHYDQSCAERTSEPTFWLLLQVNVGQNQLYNNNNNEEMVHSTQL